MFQLFNAQAYFHEVGCEAAVPPANARLDVDQRFPRLIGLSESGGASFARRRGVVVGVGSVGRRIAFHLARLGIETLWLVDPGCYDDRANLLTQEILPNDLGQTKAGNTGKACRDISPATRVFVYEGQVQDLDPVSMAAADVVFLATDNLAAEVDASLQFRLLGIPLVQASVHGETLVAQVRFVGNQHTDSPCLICSYGPEEYRHLNQSSIFRCAGIDLGDGPIERINTTPTNSTSFLCSLAADFALTQWTRHALGLGPAVADTLLQYCGYRHSLTQTALIRKRNCKSGHMVLEQTCLSRPLAECTASGLAGLAGCDERSWNDHSLTLGALSHVASAVCRCEQHQVDRFLPSGATVGHCATCGEAITPEPYYALRPTPLSDLHAQRHRPLRDLGGGGCDLGLDPRK